MGATARNVKLGRRGAAATSALVVMLLASACASRPVAAPRAVAPSVSPSATPTPANDGEDDTDEPDDDTRAASDTDAPRGEAEPAGPCPGDMVLVDVATPSPRRFCVDTYEASLVEVLADGTEKPFPHYLPVDGHDVRAVSKAHAFPQGYISEVQAQDACFASGKRLCNHDEWKTACMGPARTTFPYGDARQSGTCADNGKSAVVAVFGAKAVAASTPVAPSSPAPVSAATSSQPAKHSHATRGRAAQTTKPRATASKAAKGHARPLPKKGVRRTGKKSARPASVDPGVWAKLNDPALGQVDGALSKTGEHAGCVNGFGAFDMVGNLHEWVATDPVAIHGTFAGGYYLDTSINGDGCNYRTVAHAHEYHDYSTGFRCCSAAAAPAP